MTLEAVAVEHYLERKQLSDAVGGLARQVWGRIDPADLDGSWARAAPQLLVGMMGAQLAATRTADGYVDRALAEQGLAAGAAGSLAPGSLAGIASDGRPLASLLQNAVLTVKGAIGGGATIDQAMASGYANLDMLVRTQLADAGRAADHVALVARPDVTGYVRMLVGKSCSRCVVLAGRHYRWNRGFKRHPRCDCVHVPAAESMDSVVTNPRTYFNSLTPAEQDKAFTKAGAQAIRDGADVGSVVNARRGMATAGETRTRVRADGMVVNERIRRQSTTTVGGRQVFTTVEGARRKPRIMPEQIYLEARGDRAEAVRLLKAHGFLTEQPRRAAAVIPVQRRAPTFDERIAKAATGDEALDAPTFGLDRQSAGQEPAGFTPAMADAVLSYGGAGHWGLNRFLRGQDVPRTAKQADIDRDLRELDAVMAASKLSRDVLVYRGVPNARPMFGDRVAGDLTGMEWREDAFLSTSADVTKTEQFRLGGKAGSTPIVMRILTPAGTPAVEVSDASVEAEILLRRGLRLRVVKDRGIDAHGVRHIDAEVLGG